MTALEEDNVLIDVADRVLRQYDLGRVAEIQPLAGGLINDSYRIQTVNRLFVLQRLHPIFSAEVHNDIDEITKILDQKGFITPRLVRTTDQRLCVVDSEHRIWRLVTYIPGRSFAVMPSVDVAREAGRLVGRFHRAMESIWYHFRFSRPHAHDRKWHQANLEKAFEECRTNRWYHAVLDLWKQVRSAWIQQPEDGFLRKWVCHGDLKLSNLLFDDESRGLAMVDLDTIGWMPITIELGDAWRSWCNRAGEDAADIHFEVPIFHASVLGYASEMQGKLSATEIEALSTSMQTIALELSIRFMADTLQDRYFGWDQERYVCRADHNWARANAQFRLYQSMVQQQDEITEIVQSVLSSGDRRPMR